MSESDDSVLDSRLRECVSDTVPPAVESRLRARLADFRSGFCVRDSVAETPRRGITLTAWSRLGLVCAATGLIAVVLGLLLRPRASFAEVATALLDQPWIHLRVTAAVQEHQEQSELWVSPVRNVVVTRGPDSITYEDFRVQVVDSYDPREGVVYHAPIVWQSQARHYETMVEGLATLLQGERAPESPLARLDFLGSSARRMRMLDQRVEHVADAGHRWLDYHLTVAEPGSGHPVRMLFRVDAVTKLPSLSRIERQHEGKPSTVETQFDYPDAGPADLYALGVPRAAKCVDRVLVGDLKRIVETIRAGRVRMDNYRAVFVQDFEGHDDAWWTDTPSIFYRKGMNLRADYASGLPANLAATKRPDQNEDRGNWWRERAKLFQYYPMYLVRDTTTFMCNVKTSSDADGNSHQEIVSVHKTESGNNPGEIYPPEWSMRPEFACRPPLGIGDPHMEPVLDMLATDGPPGCVRLSVRHTPTDGRVNKGGHYDECRYWLDPGATSS